MNLVREKFVLNNRFSQHILCVFCTKRLFGSSISSTERNFNKSEHVRYKFQADNQSLTNIKLQKFDSSFTIIPDIVSVDEESQLIDEIEKSLKRLRYQHDHWDNAIHGYRETEIISWKNPNNTNVMQRLKTKVFTDESTTEPMPRVHVLDLCSDGYVKPHIDSIRFCGNIIAGVSLLSDSVMRLADEQNPDSYAVYAILPRRSLYVMKNDVRYKYTHEILNDGAPSVFSNKCIIRQRRVSIVMRNEPPEDTLE